MSTDMFKVADVPAIKTKIDDMEKRKKLHIVVEETKAQVDNILLQNEAVQSISVPKLNLLLKWQSLPIDARVNEKQKKWETVVLNGQIKPCTTTL